MRFVGSSALHFANVKLRIELADMVNEKEHNLLL